MAASFQLDEPGFDHMDPMPEAPDPDTLPDDRERLRVGYDQLPANLRKMSTGLRPIEMRAVDTEDDLLHPSKRPAYRRVWLKARGALGDDPAVHASLLAYASDYSFITTSLLPHGTTFLTPKMQVASLDHVMWFHRPFRIDDWMLHVMDSPSASNARGLVRGRIFTRAGVLVASTAQEGLIRQRK
jgi:acyl-CoA thioesterase-2